MKDFFTKILDIWCNWWFLIVIILVIIFALKYEKNTEYNNYDKPISYSSLSENEEKDFKIETLEEENTRLQEELSHKESLLEELKKDYEYDEELIDLLREQLENHGIEPAEL